MTYNRITRESALQLASAALLFAINDHNTQLARLMSLVRDGEIIDYCNERETFAKSLISDLRRPAGVLCLEDVKRISDAIEEKLDVIIMCCVLGELNGSISDLDVTLIDTYFRNELENA